MEKRVPSSIPLVNVWGKYSTSDPIKVWCIRIRTGRQTSVGITTRKRPTDLSYPVETRFPESDRITCSFRVPRKFRFRWIGQMDGWIEEFLSGTYSVVLLSMEALDVRSDLNTPFPCKAVFNTIS